jgi:CO/xanthine dehydrogenase Mo-binding subunit
MSPYRVLGQRVTRVEGKEKVTGVARYGTDVKTPRTPLVGKLLLTKIPCGRARGIDTKQAEALPGVKAVVTAKDFHDHVYGFNSVQDLTVMVRDQIRCMGEPLAAVAAVDEDTARRAIDLIRIDQVELEPILDPEEAMKPQARLIHERWEEYRTPPGAKKERNIAAHYTYGFGDIEKGFRESDFIFEDNFTTQMVHQAQLEPHVVLAEVDAVGGVTVWTPAQEPFDVRHACAHVLDLPLHSIRVIVPHIGGSFGGKGFIYLEPIVIRLAQKAKTPVRMILSREEEFWTGHPRASHTIHLKTGVKKDGTILARQARCIYDTGAYGGNRWLATSAADKVTGPYAMPHVKIDSYLVYTNKNGSGQFRAPGQPGVTFACEAQIDFIAARLGMDPVELRLKNVMSDGALLPTKETLDHAPYREIIERVVKETGWKSQSRGNGRGIGVALAFRPTVAGTSGASIKVNEDGSLSLITGSVDVTGARTALAQIVSEEMGVPIERITLSSIDTEFVPYDCGPGGSRMTFSAGEATRRASLDTKERLLKAASELLEARTEDLELREEHIQVKGVPTKRLSLGQIAEKNLMRGQGPITGVGSFAAGDWKTRLSFAVNVAEVEVDLETGNVVVHKFLGAHEVGFAINPLNIEGQIQGGITQGLGLALFEEVVFNKGRVVNNSFLDYKLPTALDVPTIRTVIFEESPSLDGPYGIKAIGEIVCVPGAAAIANAVFAASGVEVHDLPITPERIMRAVEKQKAA